MFFVCRASSSIDLLLRTEHGTLASTAFPLLAFFLAVDVVY